METMSLYSKFLRKIFLERYIRRGTRIAKQQRDSALKADKLSADEREHISDLYHQDMREWEEWLTSIEDAKRVRYARKMDILLGDIPLPEFDKDDMCAIRYSHYYFGMFGERLLHPESRKLLRKAMKEQKPSYLQECHARYQLWFNAGMLILGILGTIAALISAIK